jgi:L-methionine (R)-S-oxide reductase
MYQSNKDYQQWLKSLIKQLGAQAGTVHVERGGDLYLTAAHKIPAKVIEIVVHVPRGKGMAGVAQLKKEPVQTCNLQTDETGNIKPGAKAVDAQSAIALPVFDEDGAVRAVVGLAWSKEGEIGAAESASMMKLAATLPE